MSKQNKPLTHWKEFFDYNFLGSQDLEITGDTVVTFKAIKKENHTVHKGEKKDFMVAYFEEFVKPMIINKTNNRSIAIALGSPYVERWIGNKVSLYVKNGVQFGGEEVEAIRVQMKAPSPTLRPVVKKGNKEYKNALAARSREKPATWEAIEKKYTVSAEMKTSIDKEAKASK